MNNSSFSIIIQFCIFLVRAKYICIVFSSFCSIFITVFFCNCFVDFVRMRCFCCWYHIKKLYIPQIRLYTDFHYIHIWYVFQLFFIVLYRFDRNVLFYYLEEIPQNLHLHYMYFFFQ